VFFFVFKRLVAFSPFTTYILLFEQSKVNIIRIKMFSERANFIGLCILFIVVKATYSFLSSSVGSNGAFGISYDERGIAKVSVSNK